MPLSAVYLARSWQPRGDVDPVRCARLIRSHEYRLYADLTQPAYAHGIEEQLDAVVVTSDGDVNQVAAFNTAAQWA